MLGGKGLLEVDLDVVQVSGRFCKCVLLFPRRVVDFVIKVSKSCPMF